jgi:RNA-directed DNA polymerase
MGYLGQFLNRGVEWGGLYQDIRRGIPRGAALSPRLGAFYLRELDRRLESLGVKYFRYMDDLLILAATRWKLRTAIRELNRTFAGLKLGKHPDKTARGRVERGFDFLGYHFHPSVLSLAAQTRANCARKPLRLYEQEPPHLRARRLGEYLRRWQRGAVSGGVAEALAGAGGSAVISSRVF